MFGGGRQGRLPPEARDGRGREEEAGGEGRGWGLLLFLLRRLRRLCAGRGALLVHQVERQLVRRLQLRCRPGAPPLWMVG